MCPHLKLQDFVTLFMEFGISPFVAKVPPQSGLTRATVSEQNGLRRTPLQECCYTREVIEVLMEYGKGWCLGYYRNEKDRFWKQVSSEEQKASKNLHPNSMLDGGNEQRIPRKSSEIPREQDSDIQGLREFGLIGAKCQHFGFREKGDGNSIFSVKRV